MSDSVFSVVSHNVTVNDEAAPSYGLESIILHHSFKNVRGRTVQVDCRQRTHLGGINGAGKTSILALIPAFYGEEPERIVAKSSGRQSFLDYYLPSLQSLIIFEYQKHGGPCCSVMYRNPAGKLSYRFIEGSATDTFFHPGVVELLEGAADNAEIFARLGQIGVELSSPLYTITDYRAVIQRNARLLRRRPSETRAMRDLAGRYGLGGPDTKMAHIDRLTHVVLNKDRLLSSFKTMVCESFFDDVHLNRRPKPVDREGLVNDIDSLKGFDREESSIRACIQKESERKAVMGYALQTAADVGESIKISQENHSELCRAREKSKEDQEALRITYAETDLSLNQAHTTASTKYDLTQRALDALQAQQDVYEEKNVAELDQELVNLPERERALASAQADFTQMTSRVAQAESEYTQGVQKTEHEFRNEQERRNTKVRDTKDSITQARRLHDLALQEIKLASVTDGAAIERDRSGLRTNLSDQLIEARTLRDNVGETADETQRLGLVETAVVESEAAKDRAEEMHRLADIAEGQARSDQKTAVAALEQSERHVTTLRDRETALSGQLYPEDGTWISMLRKENAGWGDTLAKVVNPDLLYLKDLNPERVADQGAGVMGWSLLLDNVPVPDFAASDEELKLQLERLARDIDAAIATVRQAENAAEAAGKTFTAKRREAEKRKTELSMAVTVQGRQRVHRDTTKDDVRQAKDHRKAIQTKAVELLDGKIAAFDSETKALIAARSGLAAEQTANQNGLWSDQESRLRLAFENLQELVTKAAEDHKARMKRRADAYSQKLQADGINPDIIKDQRRLVDLANQAVVRIRDNEELVIQYRRWIKAEWAQVPELTASAGKLSVEVGRLASQRKSLKVDYDDASRKTDSIQGDLKAQIKKLAFQLEEARNTVKKSADLFDGGNSETVEGEAGDLVTLTKDLQDQSTQLLSLRNDVLRAFKSAQGVLNRYTGTQVYAAWQKFTEYRSSRLTDPGVEFEDGFRLSQVDDLRLLLDTDIPDIRSAVAQLFSSEAGTLKDYFLSLESMITQVRRVSSQLRQKMNLNQKIESITDIEVVLKARIEDDESWRPLKSFVRSWGDWHALHRGEMPSDSLVSSFKQVTDTLRAASIGESIESMVDMTLSMKENGNPVSIRNDNDFRQVSSEGLSYLAIMAVFMGMTRYLCPDLQTRITWPVDEIGKLDPQNIARLASMLEENNLTMISACPELSRPLRKFFETKSFIREGRIYKFENSVSDVSSDTLLDGLARPRQKLTSEVAHDVR